MRNLLLLSFLAGTALQAQTITDSYIELTVSDTIAMRLKSITYEFTPQSTEMSADAAYEENTDWEKAQKKVEQEAKEQQEKLMKDLTKEGFKVTAATGMGDGYMISSYEDASTANGVSVEVATEADLKRLVAYLRAHGKGDGNVSKWDYEPSTDGDVELVQRLYKKAAAQAGTVATLGGRKLGKLINAHDPDNGIAGHWLLDLIGEIGRHEMMKGEFGDMPGFLMGRERSMVFRFALD